jgi:outer membrane receptor protein involved in Fe transport
MTIPAMFGAVLAVAASQAPAAATAVPSIQVAAVTQDEQVITHKDPQQVQQAPPQASPPAAPEPSPLAAKLDDRSMATGPASGVVRYDMSFFAAMRPNTAKDMIARVPGFTFKDVDQNVRGFAGAAGNVLIDGDRPTTKSDTLDQILYRIPATTVDHIDIIRGGAPGIDMQGQTVVANVVRKKGGSATGLLAAADQFFPDGREAPAIRIEGTKRWDGHALEGSFFVGKFVDDGTGDGHTVRYDPSGAVIRRTDLQAKAGGSQGVFSGAYETPLAGGKLRLSANALVQTFDDDENDVLTTGPGTEYLRSPQTKVNSELSAHYEKALGPKWGIEALAIQQYDTQDNGSHFFIRGEGSDLDDLFDEKDKYGETIGRAIVRYHASDKLSFEGTAEGAFNWLQADTSFIENGAPVDIPAAHVHVEEKRGELSGQATWKPSARLMVEAGLRGEVSTISSSGDVDLEKTLFFPKPRLVVTWSPDEKNQLRFRAEREVGQLNFRDFVSSSSLNTGSVQAGNPDLEPQTAWVGEATYERRFWGDGAVTLTYRHSEIQDAVDRVPIFDPTDPTNVFDAPGNIGDGHEDDFIFGATIPLDRFGLKRAQLKGSGTFRWSRVTDPTTGETRRITAQHPWDFEIHFNQDIPRWKLNWGVDLNNRWTETYYRFNEIDRYALKTWVDVFVEYKPKPDLALRFEVDNLGARGLERDVQIFNGPRNTNPLAYSDFRYGEMGRIFYIRVRHTIG